MGIMFWDRPEPEKAILPKSLDTPSSCKAIACGQKGVKSKNRGAELGSNLGPLAAENHVFGPNITQYRPKRINNLAHPLLFRDQGAEIQILSPTIQICSVF
jgi:hypothetical protein